MLVEDERDLHLAVVGHDDGFAGGGRPPLPGRRAHGTGIEERQLVLARAQVLDDEAAKLIHDDRCDVAAVRCRCAYALYVDGDASVRRPRA